MSRILAVLTLCVIYFAPLAANCADLLPVTQFTVREVNSVRSVDSDSLGFFGFIQESSDFNLTDETFVEFDVSSLAQVQQATLHFTIVSSPPGNNVLVERTFDLSNYEGSGIPDPARLGLGTFLTTLFIEAQLSSHMAQVKQFSIDVTSLVQSSVAGGIPVVGFRMHHPVDITPGSDSVPHVEYVYDSTSLSVIPEPSGAMVAAVLSGFFVCRRRFRRG